MALLVDPGGAAGWMQVLLVAGIVVPLGFGVAKVAGHTAAGRSPR